MCINMHGVLLKVAGSAYYLCPCCGQLRVWDGSGNDLCPALRAPGSVDAGPLHRASRDLPWYDGCDQGTRTNLLARRRREALLADPAESGRCSIPTRPLLACVSATCLPCGEHEQSRCLVCDCKPSQRAVMVLPDVHRMALVRCSLCARHSVPAHLRRSINNTLDLERFLWDTHRAVSRRAPKGGSRNAEKTQPLLM